MRPALTLVTGASGFVGAAVARCLLENGFRLRLMHRASSRLDNLDSLDAERVEADLDDHDSLASAVAGCDALFHVAADYRLWVPQPQVLYRTNLDGTLALLRAADAAGVRRCVYTSSVATLKVFTDGRVSHEDVPVTAGDIVGDYKRSKFVAEQAVLEFNQSHRMECVVVNPSTPVGPGDVKPTPTGKMVRDAAAGRMPAYVDTGLNIVHVDDVARGHLLAYERGEPGRRYILGGEDMSLREILDCVAALTGRRGPLLELPRGLLWPLAHGLEAWARMRRSAGEPMLTRDALRMSRYQMFFSSARARSELGYEYRSAQEALADAVNWFRGRPG